MLSWINDSLLYPLLEQKGFVFSPLARLSRGFCVTAQNLRPAELLLCGELNAAFQ